MRNIITLKPPKKPRKIYVVAAAVIILVGTMIGLITNPSDTSAWLTEKEIVYTFNAHNLAMEKDNNKKPADYAIGGIEPGIFRLKAYDGTIYVYVFDNIDERYANSISWRGDDNKFNGSINTYPSKNASVVLEAPFGNGDLLEANESNEFHKLATIIFDTVFLYLNDGKTVVYHGESQHWVGTYTLKYYNNPIEDENSSQYLDNYGWGTSQLAYRGDDLERVGSISYKYDRTGSSGEGTGLRVNDEGIVTLGGISGNGAISTPPQEVTITVMWNDQEESLVLQP